MGSDLLLIILKYICNENYEKRDWNNSITDRIFALHTVNHGSISGTPCGSLSSSGVTPEQKARN